MKKILIVVLALIVVAIGSIFGYTAYLDREQNKDFTGKLGAKIEVCDSEFSSESREYLNIENWLDSHKSGWRSYFITVPTGTVILGERINLIVLDNWVIATSHNDGVYSISAPTSSIEIECKWNDS
ncbi:MAG: hypothetical protein ACI8XV_003103 [Arenicella sp.]|jgi:hypothetical protein